jgi:hypothetical protein
MFKCTGKDGKVSFQGTPCDGTAQSSATVTVEPPTGNAPPASLEQIKKELADTDKRLNERIAKDDRQRAQDQAARDRFNSECDSLKDDMREQLAWTSSVSRAVRDSSLVRAQADYRKLKDKECPGFERWR